MARKQKNNGNNTRKTIRLWHRWVGYASLFFVLILSITGLILNRAEKLELNQIKLRSEFISSLYGQLPSSPPIHFKVNGNWISWLEGDLYLDGQPFARNIDPLVGGAILDDLIIIGMKNSLSLYLKDGSLVDTLDNSALPGQINAIGQSETDNVLIETPSGIYGTDDDFISWHKISPELNFTLGQAVQAPKQVTTRIMQGYSGQGVTLSRLILDLHSGNIMGSMGSYVMDLAALCLIFLGLSGLFNRKRSEKDRRKRK